MAPCGYRTIGDTHPHRRAWADFSSDEDEAGPEMGNLYGIRLNPFRRQLCTHFNRLSEP